MIHVAVIYFASAAVAAIDDFVFYYRVLQASGKPPAVTWYWKSCDRNSFSNRIYRTPFGIIKCLIVTGL